MSTYLSPDIQAGLDAARRKALKQSHRLRIEVDGISYRVLQAWENGFSLDRERAENLRGRVALYDGAKLVSDCLIIASEEDGEEMRFEYKQMTEATGEQPLDFVRAPDAPIGLIESR